MTAIAEELDRRMQTLEPERAKLCERIVRALLISLNEEKPEAPAQDAPLRFVTRTHSFGLKPGIDPTKLGQLAEDL